MNKMLFLSSHGLYCIGCTAPYIITKFHHSQEILERLILGFVDAIEVLEPRHLRRRIRKKLERARQLYQ